MRNLTYMVGAFDGEEVGDLEGESVDPVGVLLGLLLGDDVGAL